MFRLVYLYKKTFINLKMASNNQASKTTASRYVIKNKPKLNINRMLSIRELGLKRFIGYTDQVLAQFYSKYDRYLINKQCYYDYKDRGGIFNLEFSLDGSLLVAACEENCIVIYNSNSQKRISIVPKAHEGCVNCVRFIDDRIFATSSDDSTIKLWDLRYISKHPLKTLHGHSNWVKNIEFSDKDNLIVTSALDGSIYAWDLSSSTENSLLHEKVFLMNGLMRMKLSPDSSKMIISTTSGYIIIIHDLNIGALYNDFKTFKPILYRLMQTSSQSFPAGTVYNHLFHPSRRRNRVEFIDDFPIDSEVISSLQIHPYNWNCVSRSLSKSESDEVTCVHDIHKREPNEYEDNFKYIEEDERLADSDNEDAAAAAVDDDNDDDDDDDDEEGNQRPTTDLWMGYISNFQYSNERRNQPNVFENFTLPAMGMINSGLIGRNNFGNYFRDHPEDRNKVVNNIPRLTHYIAEKNVGRGFIKELCYSPDGRIICSPYNKGIRLLAFNEDYQELAYCLPDTPKPLTVVMEMNNYHEDVVVSCKFNPRDMQLVSGCLKGDIVWYRPIL